MEVGNITKAATVKSFLYLSLKDSRLLFFVTVLFKGTLMQIWKFHYMLGFMQKQYPGNFAILNLKNSRVIYPWSLNFSKK